MTEAQKRLRELRDRQSRERQRMVELSRADELTDETRAELDRIEQGTPDLERQIRAANLAVEQEDADSTVETRDETGDPEQRERLELRGRASLGRFLVAAASGRRLDGPEAELAQAAGVDDGDIPIELWDVPRPSETRQADGSGLEQRAITPAPGTVGINLDVLRPQVFAPSIADKLSVEMPMVESGTYATGTITTAATADAVAKGADVPETAAAFTVATTTPHRVGASLNLSAEDVAAVGQANFESVLRQHISLVLSDELDDQLLNGDDQNDDLAGFFQRLTDPAAPGSDVAGFDDFVAAFANGIDGLWASMVSEVSAVCGVETYQVSAKAFRDAGNNDRGSISFADYAMQHTAGWWTNKRMPAKDSHVQQAILCRKGRSATPTPTRLAVAPHWGYVSVDDIYSGARKGERRYVLSVLVGDLILVQPDAYAQISFRVST